MDRSYPVPYGLHPKSVGRRFPVVKRQDDGTCPEAECPTDCPNGEVCIKSIVFEFGECPTAKCEPPLGTGSGKKTSGPGVGGIVGAVVGGLVLTGIITYLVWRFCIKSKRQDYQTTSTKVEDSSETTSAEAEKTFAQKRDQRSSTHTVHSIASTVLTRASNIIQIAYIPGVTNRATPTSPTILVPPVPPIPLALSNANSPSPYEEPHFFVPGDLRDSTYSGFSGYTDRTSVARTSYAARTSMAPSIASAVISPPPMTGMRGKAAIVSLRSTTSSGGSMTAPPVPSIDFEKYGKGDFKPPPSPGAASTFSVGSTFLNNASASTATQVRPQIVRVTSKHAKVNPLNIKKIGSISPNIDDGEDLHPVRSSTMTMGTMGTMGRDSAAVTIIDDTPLDQGPFSDPHPTSSLAHKSTTSLSAVIEDATRRAARTDARKPAGENQRERSPFSDDNATHE